MAILVAGMGLVLLGCGGASGSRLSSGASGSGAYGYVTASPTCPVERSDRPCSPRPVAAHIQAQDPSGHTVAATNSDITGRYLLALPPGTYTFTATVGSTLPRCPPVEVGVGAGSPTQADISCDTGIR